MFQKHVILAQEMTGPRKSILYHFKAFIYKIYVFIKSKGNSDKLGKLQKLALRVYIGYLIGYESINIYKVWIPYKKKVVLA